MKPESIKNKHFTKICQRYVFDDAICPDEAISLSCSTHME